jgi:hypothetical protein
LEDISETDQRVAAQKFLGEIALHGGVRQHADVDADGDGGRPVKPGKKDKIACGNRPVPSPA